VSAGTAPLLKVNNIEVIYDHVILVLKGVSLEVPEGGVVALLGANGAGKSTTLKAISNLLRAERGEVTKGTIEFQGARIDRTAAAEVVRRGMVQVMEGRRVFEHLTVEENLLTGAYSRRHGRAVKQDLERVYQYFPRLLERRSIKAGYISGGEQQMLAIGRSLALQPRLLLLDEPFEGLAPNLVEMLAGVFGELRRGGLSIVLAEQHARLALGMTDEAIVLVRGRIALRDSSRRLLDDPQRLDECLAVQQAGEKEKREQ